MNDKQIDKMLDDLLDTPVPDADAKARQQAIDMAKSHFEEEFHQGTQTSTRPIGNREASAAEGVLSRLTQPIRSLIMNLLENRVAYNAFATIAIAFVALSLVFVMPSMQTNTAPGELSGANSEISIIRKQTQLAKENKDKERRQELDQQAIAANNGANGRSPQQAVDSIAERDAEREPGSPSDAPAVGIKKPIVVQDQLQAPTATPAPERAASPVVTESNRQLRASSQKTEEILEEVVATGALNTPQSTPAKRERKMDGMSESYELQEIIVTAHNSADLYTPPQQENREEYADYTANPVQLVSEQPVSTFSIDVDTASYSLVRDELRAGYLPDPQAVRAEELINYFNYNYPLPKSRKRPFEPSISVLPSPWNADRKLVHIGIKGYDIPARKMPDSNIVFLLDVSGSMSSANKLPLVKQSVSLLLSRLKPTDKVSIVVYAGAAGTVLEPTEASEKGKILAALKRLQAGGSTAGGAGIELAYQLAEQNFDKDGVNRIILATDGDFNVGMQSNEALKTLVERKRETGIFLSVLGFGRNNYQDDMMQTLAQNGNGVAAYIDTLSEAKKVLVDEATSTLFPIAKDVKLQVEFNPATVSEYRLIGYETRHLNREDFNNDKVDAGDIGAGHTVTAIYEITPVNAENKSVDEPRYAQNRSTIESGSENEYGFLKIRYKLPNGSKSKLIQQAIPVQTEIESTHQQDAEFSIAVAGFAQLLTGGKYLGDFSYAEVRKLASANKGEDPYGYRAEFIQLVDMAQIAQD
ncbi:MAG: VWA domain-containing protein [Pseudomonadota bacterium]